MRYALHPACRVRREAFGLLFYDLRGPRLLFAETGDLLDPRELEQGVALADADWTGPGERLPWAGSSRPSWRRVSSVSNRFVEQGLRAPVNLTWEVTLACNLRCRHCLSASGRAAARELSTAEALDLVDQLHRAGVFQVNFGGGEPFMRPDFEEILAACHARGIVTCISTNGTLLDRRPWWTGSRVRDWWRSR